MILRRFAIPVFIAFLVLLVAVMARNLWRDLEDLSTAADDNAQWTILQLDTEFANLHAVLLEEASKPQADLDVIRLRTDITLSRIDLVNRGVAGEIIRSDERAKFLLSQIRDFAEEAIALVDGDLATDDIRRLTELTAETSPKARQLALRGIQIGADRTEASRNLFSEKLKNTGLVAILLIGVLAGVLVILNRMLLVAHDKDKRLQASRKRLASTISGSLDAIVTCNRAGEILEVNPAAEGVFDWKKEELAGRNVNILLPATPKSKPLQYKESENAFAQYVGEGRVEIIARKRTGVLFPCDLSVTADGDASYGLIICYLRDISDQKINEQALIDSKERAERTDQAKSQFLTVMSHEMRTPLNGVLGVLDLFRTTELSDHQRRLVDVATASGEVLMQQLHEALDITRIETGSLILAPRRFNLRDEIIRIVTVLEPLATEKGVVLTHDIDHGMNMDFVADGIRIGQIVTNLVGNAIKFTSSGSVDVSVSGIHSPSETSANISVRDTGIGIPKKHWEAIFEDFVALSDSGGRMSRGDGLGLSISRKTARFMGGDIKMSSVEGSGSEFTLTLPLTRADDLERQSSHASLYSSASVSDAEVKILVVEDNDINRTVLQEMLESMGHIVTTAAGGKEGYELAQRQPFDLILMDINMPELDGIELTRMLRETDGPNREVRIQGLTAYGREEFLHIAEAAGMDGFSTKPIRLKDISAIIGNDQVSLSQVRLNSDGIDGAVVEELKCALGELRLQENADRFFRETATALFDMRSLELPRDRMILQARLHDMSGAAALFGLTSLTDTIAAMRSGLNNGVAKPLDAMLKELETCTEEARTGFLELVKSGPQSRTG